MHIGLEVCFDSIVIYIYQLYFPMDILTKIEDYSLRMRAHVAKLTIFFFLNCPKGIPLETKSHVFKVVGIYVVKIEWNFRL